MATGAIATYTSLDADLYRQTLLIGAVFLTVALPCVGLWLLGGVGLKTLLQTPKRQRLFNLTMAGLLISSMIPVLYAWVAPLWPQGAVASAF